MMESSRCPLYFHYYTPISNIPFDLDDRRITVFCYALLLAANDMSVPVFSLPPRPHPSSPIYLHSYLIGVLFYYVSRLICATLPYLLLSVCLSIFVWQETSLACAFSGKLS